QGTLLCTVSNDRFAAGTAVMLYSMKKHVRKLSECTIEVLTDNTIDPLSEKNRTLLKKIIPGLIITDVSNSVYRNARCQPEHHRLAYLTLEAFSRSSYERVLFFDGDMLCINDFSAVLKDPHELFGCKTGPRTSKTGLSLTASINTGFFGISGSLLSQKTYQKILEVVQNRKDKYIGLLDQKTINKFRKHSGYPVWLIDYMYNYRDWDDESRLKEDLDRIKNLHYSGYSKRPKPWEYERRKETGYHTHLAYTLWDEYARNLAEKFPEAALLLPFQPTPSSDSMGR
ncbi:MAG: glycosyltransferase, partial [Fibrobacterota bacterium]